jgi:hypothetical protein
MENRYALIEEDHIHTDWLTLDDANEMLERHSRIFPDIRWNIAPMSETKTMTKLKGYLERQKEIAIKYHS